uniref:Uncharacterized protein n=1 Tax=Ananas comosus var. bracteatus TaxID=296719 RepID=A0A6V7PWQ6_ANACO|nr:unnamed protein product [Ananas comosus var. bracteatus]
MRRASPRRRRRGRRGGPYTTCGARRTRTRRRRCRSGDRARRVAAPLRRPPPPPPPLRELPPIHHSRESSTALYSAPLKHAPWRKLSAAHSRGAGAGAAAAIGGAGDDEEEEEEEERVAGEERNLLRRYACLFLAFVLVFTLFSLILWGATKSYKPKVLVKSVVFESYNIQAGMDYTGVPTKMMSLNSTVRIAFRNPGTFFGVHVTSTPLDLYFYDLKVASGYIKEFYQPRQSGRVVTVGVGGRQVPLYGGGSGLSSRSVDRDGKSKGGTTAAVVPLNLTFVVRARAHVLGYLVKSKFYLRVRCALSLREAHLGSLFPPSQALATTATKTI